MTLPPQQTQALIQKRITALKNPVYRYQVKLWSNQEGRSAVVTLTAPIIRTNQLTTLRQVWKFTKPSSSYKPIEILSSEFHGEYQDWQRQNPQLDHFLRTERRTNHG